MGWTVADITAAVTRAQGAMDSLEQKLNVADAKLGDGDTGGMLKRVLDRMAAVDQSGIDDAGIVLGRLAKAAASATGSSLGTLLATGLLTVSRELRGQTELAPNALGGLVARARDAMMARGGAELGDKTVLDTLNAVVEALEKSPDAAVGETVVAASSEALDDFRNKPCRRGRARMFGDDTIGIDDPGMLAFAKLAEKMVR